MNGTRIIDSIRTMHDRSNGLGGGFAGYGIYPEYAGLLCVPCLLSTRSAAKRRVRGDIRESISTSSTCPKSRSATSRAITDEPLIWRYFVAPLPHQARRDSQLDEKEYVARVGHPHQLHARRRLHVSPAARTWACSRPSASPRTSANSTGSKNYEALLAGPAHGRYPTNTPGWWGGAHPFALLDYYGRPQRRDLVLRRKPPLHRDVRLFLRRF